MDEKNLLFSIETRMEGKDYRKFLYIATFFRKKMVIPMILLLSGAMAYLLSISENGFSISAFLVFWLVLLLVGIASTAFQIERKNKVRIKTDKTGTFGAVNELLFFENEFEVNSEVLKSQSTIEYEKIYQVLESKDYFIVYFNANQAAIVRKEDMDIDIELKVRDLFERKIGKKYLKINMI
jgi:hypothetical protein